MKWIVYEGDRRRGAGVDDPAERPDRSGPDRDNGRRYRENSVRWPRRPRSSRHCPRSSTPRCSDDGWRRMTAPEADLTGWTARRSPAAGFTHDVYRKGEGPGVVLIPEMPGLHPGVLALGNHLVDNGFTVAAPSLFGTPGAPGEQPAQFWSCCVAAWQGNSRPSPRTRTDRWRTYPAGAGPRSQRQDAGQGRRRDRRVLHRRLRAGGRGRRQRAGAGAQPAVAARFR